MKQALINILQIAAPIRETLTLCEQAKIKDYYVAGGAITQLIWNWKLSRPLTENLKDIDVIYFNRDEPFTSEKSHETFLNQHSSHPIPIDVKNQAYVHQWYPQKYGRIIPPYTQTEDGILSWLPAFAIGVRKRNSHDYQIYAPYGLEDAFAMVIRPNKKIITKANYQSMVRKYKKRWPQLTALAW